MWEFLGLVSVLLLIGFPVLAIAAFYRTTKLTERQAKFEKLVITKIRAIEDRLSEIADIAVTPSSVVAEKTSDESLSEEPASDESEGSDAPEPDAEAPDQESEDEPETQEAVDEPIAARSSPWPISAKPKSNPFDLESLVGGRWSVLLGGLALALGIVFLVKYSIEEGLLGPGPRTVLGGLVSAALLAAGEWLRRSDRDFDLPVYAKADVPGILTGAGAIGAFATLYAAHALYGFIGPGLAFVALTVVGICALLLSTIHGPKLAAVGLLGAYATPLLVVSNSPNPIALTLHILTVTAVVLALAHIRSWLWLAIAGIVAACAWIILAAIGGGVSAGIAGIMLLAGIALIFAALFFLRVPEEIADRTIEWVAILAFSLLTFSYLGQLLVNSALPATLTAVIVTVIIAALASYRAPTAPMALCAAIISLFTIMVASLDLKLVDGIVQTGDLSRGLVPPDISGYIINAFIVATPAALVLLWGTRRAFFDAPRSSAWLASAVGVVTFFGLVITYLRIAPFETRPVIGAAALGFAGLFAVGTEYFIRLAPEDKQHPVPAAFAVTAIACTCFAISVSLDTGWMPLAFGLTALGITAVYLKRPVTTLPWLALASGGICGITLYANMPFELPEVSQTLLFNGLIVLLGIPAAALLAGGEVLRRATVTSPSLTHVGLTSGGLAIAGLFAGLEVTHVVNGGDLASSRQSLAETAGHTLAAMGFAMGLQKLGERSQEAIYHVASQIAGVLSVLIAAVGLLVVFNPFLDSAGVGSGIFFNLLLPGYLMTGLAAAAVALLARPVRPRWYTLMYAALSGLLLFTYFSLMLRKGFQGQYLEAFRHTDDLEFWLYSPLWLVMGAILLAIGLKLKSLPIRMASGLLIALTVFKVFLLDMSALTGVLRAFSFIGLGLSLIVIGRFYQRILTRQAKAEKETTQSEGEEKEEE